MSPLRIRVLDAETGTKVFITWPDQPDAPATTVLHGAAYALDHLGYTPEVPAQAVEFLPTTTVRERA